MTQRAFCSGRDFLVGVAGGACLLCVAFIAGSTEQLPIAKCAPAAKNVHRTEPPHPQRAHLYITGTVVMEVRLERIGTVGALQVLDSSVLPNGRSAHAFDSDRFEQDLLVTIRQWRFAPVPRACTRRLAITYQIAD